MGLCNAVQTRSDPIDIESESATRLRSRCEGGLVRCSSCSVETDTCITFDGVALCFECVKPYLFRDGPKVVPGTCRPTTACCVYMTDTFARELVKRGWFAKVSPAGATRRPGDTCKDTCVETLLGDGTVLFRHGVTCPHYRPLFDESEDIRKALGDITRSVFSGTFTGSFTETPFQTMPSMF